MGGAFLELGGVAWFYLFRDNAIKSDGRVFSRWAYDNSDAMPGTTTPKGFYEAQWGYLMDSNPDFVTNVAELYDQCGDKIWVAKQRLACEKTLDYMLKRDDNGNHLVEMMPDSEQMPVNLVGANRPQMQRPK